MHVDVVRKGLETRTECSSYCPSELARAERHWWTTSWISKPCHGALLKNNWCANSSNSAKGEWGGQVTFTDHDSPCIFILCYLIWSSKWGQYNYYLCFRVEGTDSSGEEILLEVTELMRVTARVCLVITDPRAELLTTAVHWPCIVSATSLPLGYPHSASPPEAPKSTFLYSRKKALYGWKLLHG